MLDFLVECSTRKESNVVVNTAEPVDYASSATPSSYTCGKCGATNCKLWREYSTLLDHQTLFCLNCACENQDKIRTPTEDGTKLYTEKTHYWYRTAETREGWWQGYDPENGVPPQAIETKFEREKTNQIGSLLPAVPTQENDTFWGYGAVPDQGWIWWENLPSTPTKAV